MAAKKEMKEQALVDVDIDMAAGVKMMGEVGKKAGKVMAGLVPTQENKAKWTEAKHRKLESKLAAMKKEKGLLQKIAVLKKEIAEVKGGERNGKEGTEDDAGNNPEDNPQP